MTPQGITDIFTVQLVFCENLHA